VYVSCVDYATYVCPQDAPCERFVWELSRKELVGCEVDLQVQLQVVAVRETVCVSL
jgi:hypothetical protein